MRRIQIHLEESVDDALAREALARHTSKAALIREFVTRHVVIDEPSGPDPFDALIGAYEGTPDESEHVNEVVYG